MKKKKELIGQAILEGFISIVWSDNLEITKEIVILIIQVIIQFFHTKWWDRSSMILSKLDIGLRSKEEVLQLYNGVMNMKFTGTCFYYSTMSERAINCFDNFGRKIIGDLQLVWKFWIWSIIVITVFIQWSNKF